MVIYLFVGLVELCDEYFVPGLQILGDSLGMSEDVQGASLMAAGSSAPELFTALIGIFFYKGENPGPGTNVGSAIYNALCIIGFSALLGTGNMTLQLWPLVRDSVGYILSVSLLWIFAEYISPGQIEWWEGGILALFWVLYCVMLYNNRKLLCCSNAAARYTKYVRPTLYSRLKTTPRSSGSDSPEEGDGSPSKMKRNRSAEDVQSFLPGKGSLKKTLWHCATSPYKLLYRYTIPDPRRVSGGFWYAMIFGSSILWLGTISFILVDVAEKISTCLEVSPEMTGMTFLAIGSSLPDTLGSVIVAREGKAQMAVSNALGSNVFDIAFAMGFSFFCSILSNGGAPVKVNAGDFSEMVTACFLSLFLLLLLVFASGLRLRRWHGVVLILSYVLYIARYSYDDYELHHSSD